MAGVAVVAVGPVVTGGLVGMGVGVRGIGAVGVVDAVGSVVAVGTES
jgi:hypothetical protein